MSLKIKLFIFKDFKIYMIRKGISHENQSTRSSYKLHSTGHVR